MRRPLHALVFDFDGTLVDSLGDLHGALVRLLAEQGRPAISLAAARRAIGDGARNLVARAFASSGEPLEESELDARLARFLELYSSEIARLTRPYPGVVETLERFRERGIALGLCTNKPEGMTRLLLDALDLAHFFGAVVGGDTLPRKKPDPAPLLAVLSALGAEPEEALMVGDATQDFEVARRAGLPVVLLSYGYSRVPVSELGADAVIEEFPRLLEICEDRFGLERRAVEA